MTLALYILLKFAADFVLYRCGAFDPGGRHLPRLASMAYAICPDGLPTEMLLRDSTAPHSRQPAYAIPQGDGRIGERRSAGMAEPTHECPRESMGNGCKWPGFCRRPIRQVSALSGGFRHKWRGYVQNLLASALWASRMSVFMFSKMLGMFEHLTALLTPVPVSRHGIPPKRIPHVWLTRYVYDVGNNPF
ncbi:hypothetical protein OKW30_005824 [Paraburkholderia sp. Clong3]